MRTPRSEKDWLLHLRRQPLPRTPESLDFTDAPEVAGPPLPYLRTLLSKRSIHDEMARLDAADMQLLGLTPLNCLTEVMRIAFADPRQLVDANGQLIRDLAQLPENVRRALSHVERHTDPVTGAETVKYRFWSKPVALTALMKHLGLLQEKIAVSGLLEAKMTMSWEDTLQEARTKAEGLRGQLRLLQGGQA